MPEVNQDELRLVLLNMEFKNNTDLDFSDIGTCYLTEVGLNKLMSLLARSNVAIVKNEPAYPNGECNCGYLPPNPYFIDTTKAWYYADHTDEDFGRESAYSEAQQDMLKAGFVQVERIKE